MTTFLNDDSKRLLETVFGEAYGSSWLVRAVYDAGDSLVILGEGPPGTVDICENEDLYYCVSRCGAGGRKTPERVMVLVIDDVGKEIDRTMFEWFFPLQPTFVVETSAGSFQYGYAIDGGMSVEEYGRLRQAMKASPIWGKAHGIDAAHIFRLPQGTHTKSTRNRWAVRAQKIGGIKSTPDFLWSLLGQGSGAPGSGTGAGKRFEWTLGEAALRALVDLIPNPPGTTREAWIEVLHGIVGAGGSYEIWESYSARWAGYDAGDTRRAWDTLVVADVKSGGGLLRRLAEAVSPDAFSAWRREFEAPEAFDDGFDLGAVDSGDSGDDGVEPLVPAVRKKPKPRAWLYDKRLIRGYLSSTIAAGGTGKSSLTMVEAVSMVTGRDLLQVGADRMPGRPLRVLAWNGEDPMEELDRRLEAICLHYGIADIELGGRLFLQSGREKPLRLGSEAHHKKDVARLRGQVREGKIDVVILDPFVSTHQVSENDNVAIDNVAKVWSRLAEEAGCAVDLVHHIRKPVGGGRVVDLTVDDARGASALINASRYARVLSPMPEQVAVQYRVANRKAYFAIQHDATKANMVPGMVGTDWFHFASVDLGNGDPFPASGGSPVPSDSVGVVEAWTPGVGISDDPVKVVAAQSAIAKGSFRASVQSPDWVGYPIASVLGLDPKDAIVKVIIREWLRKNWLKSCRKLGPNRHEREYIEAGEAPEPQVF